MQPYCLIWRRRGSSDSFQHFVTANSLPQAVERSRTEVRLALTSNSVLWILDGFVANGNEATEVDVGPVKPEPNRPGKLYSWLMATFLSFGLTFLLISQYQTEPARQSNGARADTLTRASTETVASPTRVEKALVELSVPGVVFSNTTVKVRASRLGRFTARGWIVGDRIVAGEVIGGYDLSFDPPRCQLQSPDTPWRCDSEDGLADDSETVTAPVTGTIVTDLPDTPMEVNKGTLLVQIAQESELWVRISRNLPRIDLQQTCEVWNSGSFLSFGEFVRQSPGQAGISRLSLRLLDQFAAVIPGMEVDVRCAQL